MSWFYAPQEAWSDDRVVLPPDESRHAAKVLRLGIGDAIGVIDGSGTVARCTISAREGERLVARIESRESKEAPQPRVVVYQAAMKAGKLDTCVERLAELGVAEIHAFTSERTIARWDRDKVVRLNKRYRAIARSAAKQSRGAFITRIDAGMSWDALLAAVAREPLAVMLWEQAAAPLRGALRPEAERVAIVVGPEGGFAGGEADALVRSGAIAVSLGPPILRAENAALVATSALMFHHGLLG